MMSLRRSVALACAMLLLPEAAGASISEKIRAEQQNVHHMHEQLHATSAELHATQAREEYLRAQLGETQSSIGAADARLAQVSAAINVQQRKIAWNRVQLGQAQATVQRHTDALRHRLVDVYENGNLGYLQVLLSARSFSEFVERWDDIRFLIAANERTVRERKAAEKVVADLQSTLEHDAAALSDEQAREQRSREQLRALEETRSNLVAVADDARRRSAARMIDLEESSQEQENALQQLIVQKQREEAAAMEAARDAARRAAALSGKSVPGETGPGAPGDLSWPVSGPITSPFGMRLDPVSGEFTRMHTGIDIGAPMGSTIDSAAAGRVILAGWTDGGYGNMIVVDHGGGLSTVYAHCSQIFVSAGQDVSRGTPLGAVGSTGHSTGPHLHFEVRINGQPVDPTARRVDQKANHHRSRC